MQWEYTVAVLNYRDIPKAGWVFKTAPSEFERLLNQFGQDGWELASTLEHQRMHGGLEEVYLIFKRAC